MLKRLQMESRPKIWMAVVFLIATIDVIFDILHTIYTVDGGAIALDTVCDILEPTITVRWLSPPYQATEPHLESIGRMSPHAVLYKNLGQSGNTGGGMVVGHQGFELSSYVSSIWDESN